MEKYKDLHKGNDQNNKTECKEVTQAYIDVCTAVTLATKGRPEAFSAHNAFLEANTVVGTIERARRVKKWEKRGKFLHELCERAATIVQDHFPSPGGISDEMKEGIPSIMGGQPHSVPNTYLLVRDATFVHRWQCRREAHLFHNGLLHLAQLLFETGFRDLFQTPIAVLVSHQGSFFTVMWLCPLLSNVPANIPSLSLTRHALDCLKAFTFTPTQTQIPVFRGADGNSYIISPALVAGPPQHGKSDRSAHQRFERILMNSIHGNHDSVVKTCASHLAEAFLPFSTDSVENTLRIKLVPRLVHRGGLSMQNLHEVYTSPALKCPTERKTKELRRLLEHEMVVRTMRRFLEATLRTTSTPDYVTDEMRSCESIDAVNTLLKQVMKNPKRWFQRELMPLLRSKFNCPDGFSISMDQSFTTVLMKRALAGLNMEYDENNTEVAGFSPAVTISYTAFVSPVFLSARVEQAQLDALGLLERAAFHTPASGARSLTVLILRFYTIAAMLNAEERLDKVIGLTNNVGQLWKKNAMTAVAFDWMMGYVIQLLPKSMALQNKDFFLIHARLLEQQSTEADRNVVVKRFYSMAKGNLIDQMEKHNKPLYQSFVDRIAMMMSNVGAEMTDNNEFIPKFIVDWMFDDLFPTVPFQLLHESTAMEKALHLVWKGPANLRHLYAGRCNVYLEKLVLEYYKSIGDVVDREENTAVEYGGIQLPKAVAEAAARQKALRGSANGRPRERVSFAAFGNLMDNVVEENTFDPNILADLLRPYLKEFSSLRRGINEHAVSLSLVFGLALLGARSIYYPERLHYLIGQYSDATDANEKATALQDLLLTAAAVFLLLCDEGSWDIGPAVRVQSLYAVKNSSDPPKEVLRVARVLHVAEKAVARIVELTRLRKLLGPLWPLINEEQTERMRLQTSALARGLGILRRAQNGQAEEFKYTDDDDYREMFEEIDGLTYGGDEHRDRIDELKSLMKEREEELNHLSAAEKEKLIKKRLHREAEAAGEEAKWRADQRRAHQWEQDFDQPPVDDPHTEQRKELQAELDRLRQDEPENKDAIVDAQREIAKIRPTKQQEKADVKNLGADTFVFTDDQMYRDMYDEARRLHTMPGNHEGAIDVILKQMRARANEADELDAEAKNGLRQARREELVEFDMVYQGKTTEMQTLVDDNPVRHATRIAELQEELTSIEEQRRYLAGERTLGSEYFEITDDPMYFEMQTKLRNYQAMADADLDNANDMLEKMRLRQVFLLEEMSDEERDTMLHNRQRRLITLDQKSNFLARELTRLSAEGKVKNARKIAETRRDAEEVEAERAVLSSDMPLGPDHFEFTDDDDYRELNEGLNHLIGNGRRSMSHSDRGAYDEKVAAMQTLATKLLDLSGSAKIAFVEARKQRLLRRIKAMKLGKFDREKLKSDKKKRKEAEEARRRAALEEAERKRRAEAGEDDVDLIPEGDHDDEDSGSGRGQSEERSVTSEFCGGARIGSASSRGRSAGVRPLSSELSQTARSGATMRQSVRSRSVVAFPGATQSPATPPMSPADKTPLRSSASRRSLAHSWRRASAVAFSKMSAHDLREKIAALEAEMKTYQDDDPVRHAQKIAELEYEITELKAQLERLQDMSDLSDDSDAEDENQVSKAAGRATTRGQEIAFLASDLANAEAELERLLAEGVDPNDERVLELRARIADLRQRLAAAEMEMDDGFGGQLPEWSGAFEAGASQSSRGGASYSLSPLASMDPTTKTTILTNRGVSLAKQDSTYAEVAETVKKLEAKKKNAVLMSDVVEVFTPRRESAQSTQSGHSLRSVDASSPIPKSPLPTARPSSSAAAEKPTTEEETAKPEEPVNESDQKPGEEPEPEKPTTDAASEGESEVAKKETTSPGFDSGDRTTAPMTNEEMVALEHEITSCREKMAIRAQELGLEFVTVGELFAAVTQYEKTRVLNEEDEAPDTEAVLARAVLQAEARRVSFGQRSTSAETDRKSTYDGNVSPQSIMKQKMAGSRRRSTALSMIEKRSSIVPSQHDLLSASSARSSQAGGSDLIGREFTYMHDDVFRQLAMEARTAAQINAKYHFGQVVDTCDGMMRRADVLDDLPPIVKQTKYDQITAKDTWYMAQGIDPFTMQTPLDALKLPQTALITDPALKCLLTDFVTAIRNAPREKDVWLDILTKMALRCEAVDPEASRSPHPNSRADSNSPGGLRPPSTDSTMAGSLMNPGSRAVTSSTVGPQGQLTGLPPRYPQRTVNTEDRAKSASELVQELERLIAEDPLKNVKRIAELQKEIRIRKRREEESAKIIEEMERLAAKDPVKYAARIAALQEKLDLMDTSYEEYKFRRGGRRHRRHRREYFSSDESDYESQSGSDNTDDDSNSADSDSDSDYYYSRRRGRRGNNTRGGRRNRRDDSEERRRKKKGQRGGSDGFSRRGETPLDANAGGAVIAVQQSGVDIEFMRVIQELRQETRQLRDHNMDLATQVDQLHDRLDFATTPVRSKSPYARPLGHNHFGNEVLVAGPNGAPVLAQAFQTAPMEHFTKSPNGRYSWTPERASTRTPVRGSQAAGDYDDHPRASSKSPSKRGSAYDRSTSDSGPAGLVASDDDESAEAKMKYKYHLQIAPEDEEKARYVEDAEHVARGQMDVAAALEMSRMLLLFDFERVHFENTGVAPDGGRGPARKEMPDVALLADLAALERMEQRKRDALAREARHTMQQYVPYASEITRRHQLSAAEHAHIMDMHKEFHDTLYDMLSVAMHPASTREMHRKILALDRSVSRSQVAALQQNETNNRLTLASEYFDEFQRMQDSEETNLCLAMAKTQLRERKGRDISSLAVEAAGGIPADQLRYPMRPPGSYNTATPVLQDTLGELKTVSPAHAELRVLPLGAPGSFQHHQQQQQRQQSASAAGAGGQHHSSNANGNGNGERQSTDKLPPLFQAPQVRRVFVEPQQSVFPGIGPRVHSAPAKRVPFQHNLSPLRAAPPRLPPVAAELNKMVEKEGSSALEHPAVTQQGVVQPGLAKAIYQTATHTAEMTAETERLEKIKSTNRLEPLQNRPQSGAERSKTSLDAIRKEQEKAETIVRGVTMIQSYLQVILSGRERRAHNVELRSRAADALSVANERVTQRRCIGVWFNMARKSAMVKRLLHGTLQQHRRETYLRLLAFAAKEKKKSKAELFLTTKVLVRRRTERWATWVRFYVARLDEMASAAQANAPENFDF